MNRRAGGRGLQKVALDLADGRQTGSQHPGDDQDNGQQQPQVLVEPAAPLARPPEQLGEARPVVVPAETARIEAHEFSRKPSTISGVT